MKVKPIEEIRALLQRIADEMGIELVDVEFRQGRSPSLTAFIDTEDGVDLDTCEKYHNAIDPALDELDPTYGAPLHPQRFQPRAGQTVEDGAGFRAVSGREGGGQTVFPHEGKEDDRGHPRRLRRQEHPAGRRGRGVYARTFPRRQDLPGDRFRRLSRGAAPGNGGNAAELTAGRTASHTQSKEQSKENDYHDQSGIFCGAQRSRQGKGDQPGILHRDAAERAGVRL